MFAERLKYVNYAVFFTHNIYKTIRYFFDFSAYDLHPQIRDGKKNLFTNTNHCLVKKVYTTALISNVVILYNIQ